MYVYQIYYRHILLLLYIIYTSQCLAKRGWLRGSSLILNNFLRFLAIHERKMSTPKKHNFQNFKLMTPLISALAQKLSIPCLSNCTYSRMRARLHTKLCPSDCLSCNTVESTLNYEKLSFREKKMCFYEIKDINITVLQSHGTKNTHIEHLSKTQEQIVSLPNPGPSA